MTSVIQSTLPELQSSPDPVAVNRSDELGQDEFLKLMLAQLKHQDPFKPLENGEFVAQMAQISTVAGVDALDDSIKQMSTSLTGNQLMQSSTLIGRTAIIEDAELQVTADKVTSIFYESPANTDSVLVSVYNDRGELVSSESTSPVKAGLNEYLWDGKLENGDRAPAGAYHVLATYGSAESTTAANTYAEKAITGVAIDPASTAILVETDDGSSLYLQDIKKIK